MAGFSDKVVGYSHFLADRALRNTMLVDPKPLTMMICSRGGTGGEVSKQR